MQSNEKEERVELPVSLRDWFAGQALAGMIESHGMGEKRHEYAAHDAYRFADAMLAARQGQGGGS